MEKDLLKKLDDAIKYIHRLDTPGKKRQACAIVMHPEDCFKMWNLLSIPSGIAVVTQYKGYTVLSCDKIQEGEVIVTYKVVDEPVNFSRPQYVVPID